LKLTEADRCAQPKDVLHFSPSWVLLGMTLKFDLPLKNMQK
jgi:hypothetical protein